MTVEGEVIAETLTELPEGAEVSKTKVDDSAFAVLFATSPSFAVTLIFAVPIY